MDTTYAQVFNALRQLVLTSIALKLLKHLFIFIVCVSISARKALQTLFLLLLDEFALVLFELISKCLIHGRLACTATQHAATRMSGLNRQ